MLSYVLSSILTMYEFSHDKTTNNLPVNAYLSGIFAFYWFEPANPSLEMEEPSTHFGR